MKPIKLRNCKEKPGWCWQDKDARELIRRKFDGSDSKASALALYDAFTEIASDMQSERFQTTHDWISSKSGCSVATIKRLLPELVNLVLTIEEPPGPRGPKIYSLLAVASPGPATSRVAASIPETVIAHHELSSAHVELALAQEQKGHGGAACKETGKNGENLKKTSTRVMLPAPKASVRERKQLEFAEIVFGLEFRKEHGGLVRVLARKDDGKLTRVFEDLKREKQDGVKFRNPAALLQHRFDTFSETPGCPKSRHGTSSIAEWNPKTRQLSTGSA
ncbi:MAG: hypothetical protein ABSA83_15525 [Verrucomicrobiota bacterium]|jgi:hypothetical protein